MTKENMFLYLSKKINTMAKCIMNNEGETRYDKNFSFEASSVIVYKAVLLKYLNKSNILNFLFEYTIDEILDMYFGDCLKSKHIRQVCKKRDVEILKMTCLKKEIKTLCEYLDDVEYCEITKYNLLGDIYEFVCAKRYKKNIGMYYTMQNIIEYMINVIDEENVINNPFIKILDISCGSGHFLISIYDKLHTIFEKNIDIIREKNKNNDYIINAQSVSYAQYWQSENLNYHIITNCLYGFDVDAIALENTIINLALKNRNKSLTPKYNIFCKDSLDRKNTCETFDFIIGNPPYIGHKILSFEYKNYLLTNYKDVFKDKSDMYYCFYQRINELLNDGGVCTVITPRYFMESPSGRCLREYLAKNTYIVQIVDFYKACIFKNLGISNCIFTFKRGFDKNQNIRVYKYLNDKYSLKENEDLNEEINSTSFEQIYISQQNLNDDRWMFLSQRRMSIYTNINKNAKYKLKNICQSFQGIITGCDRAFVLTDKECEIFDIEKDILKKWIKNKNISRYELLDTNMKLIYSDIIEDKSKYKNTINHIKNYREKLEKRRECVRGIRKWYKLQWGRNISLFEKPKIVFPYKSTNNKFAIDNGNSFFSADVYSLFLKDEYVHEFSLEYIIALLNSRVYEFYFKSFAKQMGNGIYDYYPNTVMEMSIFKNQHYENIENLSKEIIKCKMQKSNNKTKEKEFEIELLIANSLNINPKELEFIIKSK